MDLRLLSGRHRPFALIVGLTLVVTMGCSRTDEIATPPDDPAPSPSAAVDLRAATSCGELRTRLRTDAVAAARAVRESPVAATAEDSASGDRAATAPAFSRTTAQVVGVDEGDPVKTDGRILLVARSGQLATIDLADPSRPERRGTLVLPESESPPQILLEGRRALVVVAGHREGAPQGELDEAIARPWETTRILAVDVSDLASPRMTDGLSVEGRVTAARLADGTAHIVIQSSPAIVAGDEDEIADAVARSEVDDWLPRLTHDGGTGPASACTDVYVPAGRRGPGTATVISTPMDARIDATTATVMGAADAVYASSTDLVLAGSAPFAVDDSTDQGDGPVVLAERTAVHHLRVDGASVRPLASGEVPGRVLDQYALSVADGRVRVTTTRHDVAGRGGGSQGDASQGDGRPPSVAPDVARAPGTEAQLSVLAARGARLEVVGSVAGLGRGEEVRAVRYLGDMAYVVTFRQTDPLYVIDLSDPARPQVRGELKVPGYSGFLLPVGDGDLLGVGNDADETTGQVTAPKVSLFDVSEPDQPRESSSRVLPGRRTLVEDDEHSFTWWGPTRTALVPVVTDRGTDLISVHVGTDVLTETGRLDLGDTHGDTRSIVVGDRVIAITPGAAVAATIDGLVPTGFTSA